MGTENLQNTYMQKINRIDENLNCIKNSLNEPVFIELIGTAKSGKTTLLGALKKIFEDKGIKFQTRQETAEYNPIANKDLEEYNIWMIMEIMKNLSEDVANRDPRVIVYDRGMIDRLPWINYAVQDGTMPINDANLIKNLFKSEFLRKYRPLTYNFLTSPEISVLRKGREGRLVNLKNVKRFNTHLLEEVEKIKSYSDSYYFVETDSYQGKIKNFILDMSDTITSDIRDKIRKIEFNDEDIEK